MAGNYQTFRREPQEPLGAIDELAESHPSPPPTDRGDQANLVLLGCSLLQLPIWGKFCIDNVITQQHVD